MAWQKGQSGNPKGRTNEKLAVTALKMQLAAAGDDSKMLRTIMDKVIALAVEGERWAVELIFDRLDGKPKQQIDMGINDSTSEDSHTLVAELLELQAQVAVNKPTHKGTGKLN